MRGKLAPINEDWKQAQPGEFVARVRSRGTAYERWALYLKPQTGYLIPVCALEIRRYAQTLVIWLPCESQEVAPHWGETVDCPPEGQFRSMMEGIRSHSQIPVALEIVRKLVWNKAKNEASRRKALWTKKVNAPKRPRGRPPKKRSDRLKDLDANDQW